MEWFKERLVLFIVGFSLVLSLFLVKLIQNPYTPTNPVEHRQSDDCADNYISPPFAPSSRPLVQVKPKPPKVSQGYQENPKYSRLQKYDHQSQIFMALFAGLGLLIGIVGMWLLWRTLRETQSAADAARDATKAAWEAVDVTREVGQKQVRAYLHAVDGTIDVGPIMVVLSVKIKNIGNSPCIKSSCNGKMWAVHQPSAAAREDGVVVLHNVRKSIAVKSISQNFGPVSSGEYMDIPFIFFPSDIKDVEIQKLLATEHVDIYFNVNIGWEDVFGVVSKVSVKLRKDGDATYTEDYGEKRKTATYKAITISTDI